MKSLHEKVVKLISLSKETYENESSTHVTELTHTLSETTDILDSIIQNFESPTLGDARATFHFDFIVPPSVISCIITYLQVILVKLSSGTEMKTDSNKDGDIKYKNHSMKMNLLVNINKCLVVCMKLRQFSIQSITQSQSKSDTLERSSSKSELWLSIKDEILWRLLLVLTNSLNYYTYSGSNQSQTSKTPSSSSSTSSMLSTDIGKIGTESDRETLCVSNLLTITEILNVWKVKYSFYFSMTDGTSLIITESPLIYNDSKLEFIQVIMKLQGPYAATLVQNCLQSAKHPSKSLASAALTCLLTVCVLSPYEADWRVFVPGIFSGLYAVCTSGYKRGSRVLHLALQTLLICLTKATRSWNISNNAQSAQKKEGGGDTDAIKIAAFCNIIEQVLPEQKPSGKLNFNEPTASIDQLLMIASDITTPATIAKNTKVALSQSSIENVKLTMPSTPSTDAELVDWRRKVLEKIDQYLPLAFREVLKVCNSDKREVVIEALALFLSNSRQFLHPSPTYITLLSLLFSCIDDSHPSIQRLACKLSLKILETEKRTSYWPVLYSSLVTLLLESIQLAGKSAGILIGDISTDSSVIEHTTAAVNVHTGSSFLSSFLSSSMKTLSGNGSDFTQDEEGKLLFYLHTAIGCGWLLSSINSLEVKNSSVSDMLVRRNGKSIVQSLLLILTPDTTISGQKHVSYQTRKYFNLFVSTDVNDFVEGGVYKFNYSCTRNEETLQTIRRLCALFGRLGLLHLLESQSSKQLRRIEKTVQLVAQCVSTSASTEKYLRYHPRISQKQSKAISQFGTEVNIDMEDDEDTDTIENDSAVAISELNRCMLRQVTSSARYFQLLVYSFMGSCSISRILSNATENASETNVPSSSNSKVTDIDMVLDPESMTHDPSLRMKSQQMDAHRFLYESIVGQVLSSFQLYFQWLSAASSNKSDMLRSGVKLGWSINVCYGLELLSTIAYVSGAHFKSYLQQILYPILLLSVSDDTFIAQAAETSISRVAFYCGYSSSQQLYRDNMDYIVDSLCTELQVNITSENDSYSRLHVVVSKVLAVFDDSIFLYKPPTIAQASNEQDTEGTDETNDNNLQVPSNHTIQPVLNSVIYTSYTSSENGFDYIILLRDVIFETMANIDQRISLGMMSAKHSESIHGILQVCLKLIQRVAAPVPLSAIPSFSVDLSNATSDNEEEAQSTEPTLGLKLILDLLPRCTLFLSSTSLSDQSIVLTILQESFLRLAPYKRIFLPQVHKQWPVLMACLKPLRHTFILNYHIPGISKLITPENMHVLSYASEGIVDSNFEVLKSRLNLIEPLIYTFQLLGQLCGDFYSIRFIEDFWPEIRLILSHIYFTEWERISASSSLLNQATGISNSSVSKLLTPITRSSALLDLEENPTVSNISLDRLAITSDPTSIYDSEKDTHTKLSQTSLIQEKETYRKHADATMFNNNKKSFAPSSIDQEKRNADMKLLMTLPSLNHGSLYMDCVASILRLLFTLSSQSDAQSYMKKIAGEAIWLCLPLLFSLLDPVDKPQTTDTDQSTRELIEKTLHALIRLDSSIISSLLHSSDIDVEVNLTRFLQDHEAVVSALYSSEAFTKQYLSRQFTTFGSKKPNSRSEDHLRRTLVFLYEKHEVVNKFLP